MVHTAYVCIVGEGKFTLSDVVGSELADTKYYMLDVKASKISVEFMFSSSLVDHTTVQIYKTPTLTSNGVLMIGAPAPVAMDIYKNPVVSTTLIDGNTVELKGTQIFGTSPSSYHGSLYRLELDANTKYLLDICPMTHGVVSLS